MEILINILDVKDGDAIIIELFKKEKSLVMVIDGGEPSCYKSKIKPKLQKILKENQKKAPDIVVCTHYDSDHIGGLIPLIDDYITEIKQVWIHKTPSMIKGYIEKALNLVSEKQKNVRDFGFAKVQSLFNEYTPDQKLILNQKAELIIKSLPQLKKLVDLIPANRLKQVFNRQHPLKSWNEITVLGPTKEYYNNLFPSTKSFEAFIAEEAQEVLITKSKDLRLLKKAGLGPCDSLKNEAETKLTSTNKASIIIAIDNQNKRFLFTGDAGVESFKAIPDWETELRNLYFLKIPHHASDNNISKELIELMQPVYAYNSGLKFQDDAVLKCISEKPRNKEVKTTKRDGDLCFKEN